MSEHNKQDVSHHTICMDVVRTNITFMNESCHISWCMSHVWTSSYSLLVSWFASQHPHAHILEYTYLRYEPLTHPIHAIADKKTCAPATTMDLQKGMLHLIHVCSVSPNLLVEKGLTISITTIAPCTSICTTEVKTNQVVCHKICACTEHHFRCSKKRKRKV